MVNLFREAAADEADVYLSAINYGEVAYIVERRRGVQSARAAIAVVDRLPVVLMRADRSSALDAAHIKALYPVSYADAFAIALTQEVRGILLTGDPEFRAVEHIVTIQWLPQRDA